MSFFDRPTTTVDIDAANTITIRKLTYGERQGCISIAAKARRGEDGVESIDIDPGRLAMERMALSVVSWAGPGFDGRPVNRTNIEALPPEVLDPVMEALSALGAGLDAGEKKD